MLFIGGLPDTIRSSVLYQCAFGMDIVDLMVLQDEIETIKALRELLDVPAPTSIYRTAQLIGVLEYILEPPLDDLEKLNTELFEETGEIGLRDAALLQPLAQRHKEAARKRFIELRQGVLSVRHLRAWRLLEEIS